MISGSFLKKPLFGLIIYRMGMAEKLTETYKHKGLRKNLVALLKEKGISDENVLHAIGTIPRHYFLDDIFLEFAYSDKAFRIGAGQTISQPYTVAYQTEVLNVKKGDLILEIGTGSGYQTSILACMGAKIISIERIGSLHEKAKIMLKDLGYKAQLILGDGSKGYAAKQPYDKIIVTAGAPSIPDVLLKQLKIGGIMVIPVGDEKQQTMISIMRTSESAFEKIVLDEFKFVPLLGDNAW